MKYVLFPFLVFSVLMATGCSRPESPQEVSEAFWQAVLEEDAEAAADYSTLVDEAAFDGFEQQWQNVSIEWGRVVIDDNLARVTTTLREDAGGYLVRICDQGPGIPPEARERALSRFTRLDQRQGEGAGLGLAIARRIAELHKGSLTLGDRDDGGPGLCVSVWLPASA